MKRGTTFSLTLARSVLVIAACGAAHAQFVLNSGYFDIHHLPQGAMATGVLNLANLSEVAQTMRLELGDIREGAGEIGAPESWAHSVAPLVRITPFATLGPREVRDIPFTISVPTDADGTYFGVLIITPTGEPRATAPNGAPGIGDGARVTLTQVVRYAIEVIVDVPGDARPELRFSEAHLTLTPAAAHEFQVRVENHGGRWAEAVGYQFDLFDAVSGAWVASYPIDRGRLYPGAAHRVHVQLGDLVPGAYQLLVFADIGSDDVFAIRYSLDVDPTEGPPGGP
jgi:hypothetical protein